MTMNLTAPDIRELRPRITVFGVGGAGGNAVNNMIAAGSAGRRIRRRQYRRAGADVLAKAPRKIQMGVQVTEGLGAGSQPEVGKAAAEEVMDEIRDHLNGAHMVFVTAGMGGGTGTGAAPVVAKIAREMGILTVGVVTKPFQFEGERRMRFAEGGIAELQKHVDTLAGHPEPESVPGRQREDHLRRRLRDGRPGALFGRGLRHRPDGEGRPDQSRLRRRPRRHAGNGQGDDGDGRSLRREARHHRGRSRDLQSADRRQFDEGGEGPPDLDHRRQGSDPVRGRRGRDPHPRGSRQGRQHHRRRYVRREPGRHHPGVGGGNRYRQGGAGSEAGRDQAPGNAGDAASGAQRRCRLPRPAPAGGRPACGDRRSRGRSGRSRDRP